MIGTTIGTNAAWHGLQATYFTEDKDDHIYNSLVKAIVEHRLRPGSKLPEEALAETFGVSRTGIRRVLQRLAAVQLVTQLPKRGAQVTTPGQDEAANVFQTRKMLECANLPQVIARCREDHLLAMEEIVAQEQQAHRDQDGAAAIRLSAAFHVQLQAIAGNQVLTEMVSLLTLRSSLVIAVYGSPWQQGCRCHDHSDLLKLLRGKDSTALADHMARHFDDIVANLRFDHGSNETPDFGQMFAEPSSRGPL
ncbi:GntR family transcriptional regulator [Pseudomonas lundensis]|uniref:GntR family transcriptional regulator n=1 Tax=Serratia proteamaculans TaxID=28151 RepID=UPI0029820AFC|nr:GntR family transcriptional regulator [Serratia proteamaculans]MDW5500360.1 GntR family transcriptional regulator [Serratia proteamaculans]MDW5505426.1 GntR family transcriptional regulator [Pseudomonas lundensis]